MSGALPSSATKTRQSERRVDLTDFEWTPERIERLRTWWAEDVTTSEIGRRLGTTKNSVVGKAHRILLPSRPSPIGPQGRQPLTTEQRRERERRKGERDAAKTREIERRRVQDVAARNGAVHAAPTMLAVPELTLIARKSEPCCFVLGEPRGRLTQRCDAPSLPGKPMCETHHALCHMPVRPAALRDRDQPRR